MSDANSAAGQRLPPPRITRGEWALILVLVAIHFTHMVDFVIIMPLGERLMNDFQITPPQFAWIISSYLLAAGVASLFATLVMDRFDRRSVLLTMYAGFGLSTLFCGLAPNYEWMLLARTLAGVFGGLAAVAIMAVIGDVFPPEKRGRATGAITAAFGVASCVGLPAGLLLAEWFGRGAPFIALAIFSSVVWIIAAIRLPQIRGHLEHTRHSPLKEFIAVAKEGNHHRAFVFSFFMVLGTFTVAAFLAPYLMALNGWTEGDLSLIYMVSGLFTLIGMNLVGRLADRMERRLLFRILAGAALTMGIVVTNLPTTPLWVAAAALSAFMVFAAGRMVPAQAMLIGSAEPRVRGAFMSLNTAVQHLATGIAPVIAGSLIVRADDGKITGFPLVGLVAAAAALISMALAGRLRMASVQMLPRVERGVEMATESTGPQSHVPVAVTVSQAP